MYCKTRQFAPPSLLFSDCQHPLYIHRCHAGRVTVCFPSFNHFFLSFLLSPPLQAPLKHHLVAPPLRPLIHYPSVISTRPQIINTRDNNVHPNRRTLRGVPLSIPHPQCPALCLARSIRAQSAGANHPRRSELSSAFAPKNASGDACVTSRSLWQGYPWE